MKIVIIKKKWFRQKWSFKFVAENGKILVVSEKYCNYSDMMNTIISIQKEILKAELVFENSDQ